MPRINPLIGKTVRAVALADDGQAIRFDVGTDDWIVARADGECCSHTWIESLDQPDALLGVVLAVEDIEMPDRGSPSDGEVIAYYGCKITTDRGVCVIDYRNSSNGYYGGNLSWPDDSFYGGVYGQNRSTEKWNRSTEKWNYLAGQEVAHA